MTKPLWQPDRERREGSRLFTFWQDLKTRHDIPGEEFVDLHRWSITHPEAFWQEVWDDARVQTSAAPRAVLTRREMPADRMSANEVWFPGARFNFAQHLLRYRDDHCALIAESEGRPKRSMSYKTLYAQVARCQAGLEALGVQAGDRVVGFLPNIPETVIAMLAATALGALWSSSSPDFGFQGVMDRFRQIEPKVLIGTDGYRYNGKAHHTLKKLEQIATELPSLEKVVVMPFLADAAELSLPPESLCWDALLAFGAERTEVRFEQLPFDHPLYILYSSGTTGLPKCIVHGAGGTLLKHHVEQKFHMDLGREDVLFYFTTCGWMMWNWLVSTLAQGTTLLLYDGSPAYPDADYPFAMAEQNGVSFFGTSPKFLATCQKAGLQPARNHDFSQLRTVISTGAPLEPSQFHWVYQAIKTDVQLASIAGGTDIVGCFVGGNPLLPVYAGEIQGAMLGVDVAALGATGEPVIGEKGELVCRNVLPSMPLCFWKDAEMKKYRQAYFSAYPGMWHHGDYILIKPSGGVVIYGRSDATLNPGGVRIGTAEIYRIVEELPFVQDSLVVGQRSQGDTRVVLFVVLTQGLALDAELEQHIRGVIREQASPRHVPTLIYQISEVPMTINGKKVELAVTRLLHGEEVKNKEALANPAALAQFEGLKL